jgi:hypothetical protein
MSGKQLYFTETQSQNSRSTFIDSDQSLSTSESAVSKPTSDKLGLLFSKNKKATIHLQVLSYLTSQDLSNFFISVSKDDHEIKSDVLLSNEDSKRDELGNDAASESQRLLLECTFKVNLHL